MGFLSESNVTILQFLESFLIIQIDNQKDKINKLYLMIHK